MMNRLACLLALSVPGAASPSSPAGAPVGTGSQITAQSGTVHDDAGAQVGTFTTSTNDQDQHLFTFTDNAGDVTHWQYASYSSAYWLNGTRDYFIYERVEVNGDVQHQWTRYQSNPVGRDKELDHGTFDNLTFSTRI